MPVCNSVLIEHDSSSRQHSMIVCVENVGMFRTLLGTLLIASQILNGLWANATLCLRSDGTVCCIHELTQACPCCDHDHEQLNPDGHQGHHHAVCAIAENHEHQEEDKSSGRVTFPIGTPVTDGVPCGCQHRPLGSTNVPASKCGTSSTASARKADGSNLPLHSPGHMLRYRHMSKLPAQVHSPACLSVGLTLVSSTVIRC